MSAPVRRKALDRGKIKALHDAGWSHAKIADEMKCSAGTVSVVLSKMRKEEADGEKKTRKADAYAENPDEQE